MKQRHITSARQWLAAFFLAFPFIAHASDATPDIIGNGSIWYEWKKSEGGNGHWYGLVSPLMFADVAERLAVRWGGHLASFTDAREMAFAQKVSSTGYFSGPFWIGYGAGPGEEFHWFDGTMVEPELGLSSGANSESFMLGTLIASQGVQSHNAEYFIRAMVERTARPDRLPPALTQLPLGGGFDAYLPATFRAAALGAEPLTFQWKLDGHPIEGATGPTLNLEATNISPRLISVEVTNAYGKDESLGVPFAMSPVMNTSTLPFTFWKQWPVAQGGNDHWYGVHMLVGFTFTEAIDFAIKLGSQLLTLQSQSEANWFMTHFRHHFFSGWLGINIGPGYRRLQWFDGSALDFTSWASNQPQVDTQKPNAVVIDRSGNWSVTQPSLVYDVLMERTESPETIRPLALGKMAPVRIAVDGTNQLQFEVVGGPPLSFQWRLNQIPLSNQTNSTLNFHPRSIDESGDYDLVVSNAFGVAITPPVSVSVFWPKTIQMRSWVSSDGFLNIEFDHPTDATIVKLEHSYDLKKWFPGQDSKVPGTKRLFRQSIGYEVEFHRLQRYP